MQLNEYQKETLRTLPDLGTQELNILHMILGLNGEFHELCKATDDINRAEEITDILWYLSNYCNLNNFDLNETVCFMYGSYYNYLTAFATPNSDMLHINELQIEISKLTDLEKKAFAYKKIIKRDEKEEFIIKILMALSDCYTYFNISPYDSMQKNIDKLKIRFPEKFTEELATNRNLQKEREILEG